MTSHRSTDPPTVCKCTNGNGVQVEETRIAVVMVGLPARGKSLIAQKGTSHQPSHPRPQSLTIFLQ